MLAYLAVDLWWWQGPIWQSIHSQEPQEALPKQIVAEVMGESITAEQLLRYEKEQNFLAGRDSANALRRTSMLMDLVRASYLRTRTRYNDKNLPDFRKEAEEEVARLASRATTPEIFDGWIQSQGYHDRAEYINKVEARLKAQAQLERAIAPHCQVTEEDVVKHYELLKEHLVLPESRTAKHIFLETLGKDENQVKAKAESILARLQAGEDFHTLARECSEDLHSAPHGGELGIIWNDARRPLKELPFFGEHAIATNIPLLQKSRWGWHIIQAGEIRPARQQTLAECRDSLESALISAQREIAIDSYFTTGVREAIRQQTIKVHAK